MIARLFRTRPKLDSKAAEDRRSAIDALSAQEAQKAQEVLGRLAREDDDPGVRRAAVGRLSSEDALRPLLTDDSLADRAVERIIELNGDGACMALAEEPPVLAAQLSRAAEPSAHAERLMALGGHSLLIDALLGAPRERRESLLALPQLQTLTMLQELERRSRDRDKKTNRFARGRLDEIRKQTAAAAELTDELEERLESLEKTTAEASEHEQERRTVLLDRVAQSLTELEALNAGLAASGAEPKDLTSLSNRYDSLIKLQVAPVEATPAATEPAESTAADPAPTPGQDPAGDFDELTASFQALDEALERSTDFATLAAERQRLTELWLASADQAPPEDGQHRVFEQVSHRFQLLAEANRQLETATFPALEPDSLAAAAEDAAASDQGRAAQNLESSLRKLEKTLAGIGWPSWAAVPDVLSEQRALVEVAAARLNDWKEGVARVTESLNQSLEQLEALIDAGELKSARAEAGRIRKALKPLPEKAATALNRQLARASARLGELSDWQTYATTPKREALLSAMTEIAETPLSPADQASRIKALRGEWNALGPVGRSDDHKLLDTFNEMAEKAFEPCRSHFAEQAEVRAANLAAREAICESLSQYLTATDWSSTDFKAAERIMRTARDEWRAHHPVDRSAGKALEARFEALQADLHQQIKAEWDRNLEAKRQIVQEAQALAASEQPIQEQVDGAKRLQQRWKTIGSTPRRPDQTLWRDFRAACDAIFEGRDSAKRSEDQEIQSNRGAAEQLLEAFRSRLDDAASPIEATALREFQSQYAELPALPERLARALDRERDGLVRTAEQQLRDQRAAAARARLENLKAQDAEVSALEQRQLAGETVDFEAPDSSFRGRCQPNAEPVATDVLTRLVIEAEIAAELESEESDLRMSLQVEMMNAGRGREALAATPEDLTDRWCELGPKEASADALRERFFAAISVLLGR